MGRLRLVVALAAAAVGSAAAQPAAFDLVLVNGRIVDGTGAPARAGDVGIRNGRIAAIGRLAGEPATARLDVHGQVVAPGFIDVHTHADDVADHPRAENFVRMGVTTIVAGNCGSSALDIGAALDRIRDVGISPNYATFIGHNTVRAAVMGAAERDPTIAEIDRMKGLVFKGMADGAIGFSTGLQYVPGIYAKGNEIIELARVAANEGGLYATHMRNEGTELLQAIAESLNVARTLDMPIEISHLKVDSAKQWGSSGAALKLIDDARRGGVAVQEDQYAYTAGSSSLSIRFPAWALEGGSTQVKARLEDDATWARVKTEMRALIEERGFTDLAWATVASYRADPSLDGLSMRDVARKLVGDPSFDGQLEAARRLMIGGGASMVYHFMSDEDVVRIMKDPMVAVASDAGVIEFGAGVPHPRGYGDNPRVLARYVRDEHVITLEDAVRKMTSLPATFFGFKDRGVIRVGAAADLVVFNPEKVLDVATYEHPHAYPVGMPDVIINGVIVVHDGEHTGARPGQVLERARK